MRSGAVQLVKSASGIASRLAAVSIVEGTTALTRTPAARLSFCSVRVRATSAAFAAL
jgi:hypothetical protein